VPTLLLCCLLNAPKALPRLRYVVRGGISQRGTKWFPLPGGPLIHQLIINVTINSIAASFGQQERKTRK
jgi:hypothetical protein